MKYLFTADWHLGCEGLMRNTRPAFSCIEEHDRVIIENANKMMTKQHILVIIGDLCKGDPSRYRNRIKGHIFFIVGNHDNESKMRLAFGRNVWVRKLINTSLGKVLCDHHPSCYWDKSHNNSAHCYGHLHYNAEREARMDLAFPERRSADVGIDAAYAILGEYRPFTEEEFFARLGTGHDLISKDQVWPNKDYKPK